jgi:hypothetical protein
MYSDVDVGVVVVLRVVLEVKSCGQSSVPAQAHHAHSKSLQMRYFELPPIDFHCHVSVKLYSVQTAPHKYGRPTLPTTWPSRHN